MIKKLTLVLFNLLLVSMVFANPYENTFRKVVPGSQNFSDIDPLFDSQKDLRGFLYTDSVHNRLILHDIVTDSMFYFTLTFSPRKTVMIQDYFYDTLDFYTVGLSGSTSQYLSHIKMFEKNIVWDMTKDNLPFHYVVDSFIIEIANTFLNIRHINNNLIIESKTKVRSLFTGVGTVETVYPTSLWIDKEWLTPIAQVQADRMEIINLYGSEEDEILTLAHTDYEWDSSTPDSQIIETVFSSVLNITDIDGLNLYEYATNAFDIIDIFAGNFQPSTTESEFLYYGRRCPDSSCTLYIPHLVCYSYENNGLVKHWQSNSLGYIDMHYIYSEKDQFAITRNNETVLLLNYLNGEVLDSVDLAPFDHISFYESLGTPKILNIIAKSYDSIRTYSLDIATSVEESTVKPDIPSTFTLFQNHPNPFNGETRLEFANEQIQHLTLKIYNILGQEIKSIADRQFSTGQFVFYWDGKNEEGLPQSTGVYFARLESYQETHMIKLIYLK
ncbi:MAG: T9SS C-terminal target domain-containing protein [Calditrichaeota bacterium]|nr:MAG: T9SS C-terminal target domain-containing protein [Calditrichota bacterium]